jgi:hypothetical protein
MVRRLHTRRVARCHCSGVRIFSTIAANSVYHIYLTSKIRRTTPSCAFAIERSRGACSRRAYPLYSHSTPSCAPIVESVHPDSRHHSSRPLPLQHRCYFAIRWTIGCLSAAAAAVSVRAALTGKFVSALLFASVLGIFTPFHPTQFSYVRTVVVDMATLTLFAASPIVFRKSAGPLALKHTTGKL